ncbi:MAG: sulfite exporter TauE/SafE family protein [Phycisphaerales bacterium]|nr:sulfite exporter TauE/SafE family protein [Phycisphaerales bacterium]
MEWLDILVGTLPLGHILGLLGIGMMAGALGGMLGIGGGVVIIPMITLILGHEIHLAQAASMTTTPFVAIAAALGHRRERAVCVGAVKRIAPVACVAIICGVTLSIWIPNLWLQITFGTFLIYVAWTNLSRLMRPRGGEDTWKAPSYVPTWSRCVVVGLCLGFGAGILGIGGGLITVPLLGFVCFLPLRQAIATSSAIMVCTSIVGAIYKDVTLLDTPGLAESVKWWDPLEIAAWLVPACLLSSWCGARLSHKMPLRAIRGAFVVLVVAASIKLLWGAASELRSSPQTHGGTHDEVRHDG